MACFTATMIEAAASTIITAVVKKREKNHEVKAQHEGSTHYSAQSRIKLSTKLGWLNMMLWGGSLLLMFEHIWHGEVVPWLPFFTAASSPEGTQTMIHEILTAGVGMCVLVTAVWAVMVLIAELITKRPAGSEKENAA
ncbi:MAG: hypothetical protein K6F91_02780 [Ruminococcus sp.]|nr:hypothetical protein [Ruminococcus sp.]